MSGICDMSNAKVMITSDQGAIHITLDMGADITIIDSSLEKRDELLTFREQAPPDDATCIDGQRTGEFCKLHY